jgi:adenylate kinase
MRVAVTGTPGTGKTTATRLLGGAVPLDPPLRVVHLNDLIREQDLVESVDDERDSLVADLDAVREQLAGEDDLLVESHLAHHLDADRVVVLRAHPETVAARLRERGESDASAAENAESEALDVVLSAAVDRHGTGAVYEVDTTDRDPAWVAREVAAVVAGERDPGVGAVDFTDYLVGSPTDDGLDSTDADPGGGAGP